MERGRLGEASHGLSVGEVGVCAVVEYACVHDPPRNYGLLGSVTCVGRGRVPVGTLILWASLAVPKVPPKKITASFTAPLPTLHSTKPRYFPAEG
eukprot:scaffold5823_cov67-Phaeocystis_antarctica.AAC.1